MKDLKEINKILQDHENRIRALENGPSTKQKKTDRTRGGENYFGATGGLRLLISKGFFDKKQTFGATKRRLAEENYHYSDQAVQTPLNNLSKLGGPLVGFKEGGKKVYARRK